MQCAEFEERLNEALDSRKRPEWEPELRLHCETCGECRELAASYGLLLDGFHALPTPEPSTDFSPRVVDAALARPLATTPASLVAAAMAVAASLIFVLYTLAPARKPEFAVAPPRPASLETLAFSHSGQYYWSRLIELPLIGPVLIAMTDRDDSTDPYEEMAKGTGQGLAVVVLAVPPIGTAPGIITTDPDRLSDGPWPESFNLGLRPMRMLVSETFGLLFGMLSTIEAPPVAEQPAA
jgi:hypothetical protein